MFGSKWVILTRGDRSARLTFMVVSSNQPCQASSYAESAYLSTPASGVSRVSLQRNGCRDGALFPRRSGTGKPAIEVELTVNAKGKGFLIQGQSGGGAGLATAASSSCRETI